MSLVDPRGFTNPLSLQTHRSASKLHSSRRSFPQLPRPKHHTPKKQLCYDWIFSSATNIHIAIDKTCFKTFVPFDTYVLTVAGGQPISIRGIGSVDLKIKCRSNSHQSRVITLDNVLYAPGWVCNIFSDIYFAHNSEHDFEHKWTRQGIFFTRRTNGKLKAWGYTESFCGLERLVLSRKPQGRNPMLEDKDREVWSVNLSWPLGQRDKWDEFKAKELQRLAKEHEAEILAQQKKQAKKTSTESTDLLSVNNTNQNTPNPKLKSTSPWPSVSKVVVRSQSDHNLAKVMTRQASIANIHKAQVSARMSLNEISTNRGLNVKASDSRLSSLKATFNTNRGLLKDSFSTRRNDKENSP